MTEGPDAAAQDAAAQVATAVRDVLYERDQAARTVGITVDAVGPGFARCQMMVRADMQNGHGTCHGGLTFTLADTAFAYACNGYNRTTVALGCQITFLAPAEPGDVLIATAREQSRSARTGVYDIEVTTSTGRKIALFRGNAYETGGTIVPGTG